MSDAILRADCLDVLPTIPSGCADLILTDPPFNTTNLKYEKKIPTSFYADLLRILKPTGWLFCYGVLPMFAQILDAGWKYAFEYVMVKNKPTCVFKNPRPMGAHNIIGAFMRPDYKKVYYDRDGIRTPGEPYSRHGNYKTGAFMRENYKKGRFNRRDTDNPGYRNPKTVLYGATGSGFKKSERTGHPSQKPLSVAETIIKGYCPENGLVIDPFAGSGSTCVAAHQNNRRYLGIEIDAAYHKIVANRINGMLKVPAQQHAAKKVGV